MKLNTKSILYGTIILTSANLFVRILGFIYRIFLSRKIGPEGMGLFQLIFPLYMVSITLTASGIPIAVSRLIAQQKALGNNRGVRQIILLGILLVIVISTGLSVLIFFNIDLIAANLLHDTRIRLSLFIFLPCICITGLASVFKGYFYGIKDMHPPAAAEIVEQIIRMALVTILLSCAPLLDAQVSAAIAVLGMVIGELSGLLYLHHCYYRKNNDIKIIKRCKSISLKTMLKKILNIAIPITLTRLITSVIGSINSIIIPSRLIASGMTKNKAIATFGIVSGMVMPLIFVPFAIITALSVVIVPNLSESYVLEKWSNIRDKVSKSILITSITAFSTMALLIPLGYPLGMLLYNQPLAGNLIAPISLFIIFMCLDNNLGSILNGLGKQTRAAIHSTIGDVLQLTCTYLLAAHPYFGIYGFVIGFVLNSIVVSCLHFVTLIKTTGLKPDFTNWFINPCLACLLTALIVRLLFLTLIHSGFPLPWSLAISAGKGALLCIILLICMGTIPQIKQIKFFSFKYENKQHRDNPM